MQGLSKLVLVILTTLVVLFLAGLIFIYSGVYNVAATSGHIGVVSWALQTMQERSIRSHADQVEVTFSTDSVAVRRGFRSYQEMCVVCHGGPGEERGWMGQGITPTPPDLSEEASEFEDDELYWILANGIKFAGMPALSPTHQPQDIQEIVAFLKVLPEMTPEEYQAWNRESGRAADSTAATGGAMDHPHHDHQH